MATITGIHQEDGVAVSGYNVWCYDYTDNVISNLTALVDSDTTGVDGSWSVTVPDTEEYLIVITDPDDLKKGVAYIDNGVA